MDDPAEPLARIAEAAAALILPLWRSGLAVRAKADASPVTEADQRAEALILEALARDFPGVAVVSEEDAAEFGTPAAVGEQFFLVDPIDGTKAFVRGDVNFTVNIALIEKGLPVAGAVSAPALGRTWRTSPAGAVARSGQEGFHPVRARPWPAADAIALVSHTARPDAVAALKARFGFDHAVPLDSSLKLCRLAEGGADIYPRLGPTMEWDIAAGHAVLAAAGGVLTGLNGEPFRYGKADLGFENTGFVARGAPAP